MVILSCLDTPAKGQFNDADWRHQALCRDGDVDWEFFFADKFSEQRAALDCCQACPVQTACLREELRFPVSEQYGIRGGLTAAERRKLLHHSGQRPTRSYRSALTGKFPHAEAGYPLLGLGGAA